MPQTIINEAEVIGERNPIVARQFARAPTKIDGIIIVGRGTVYQGADGDQVSHLSYAGKAVSAGLRQRFVGGDRTHVVGVKMGNERVIELHRTPRRGEQIGRASCRERVCQYV